MNTLNKPMTTKEADAFIRQVAKEWGGVWDAYNGFRKVNIYGRTLVKLVGEYSEGNKKLWVIVEDNRDAARYWGPIRMFC